MATRKKSDDESGEKADNQEPAAGPHAKEHLTNHDLTPGAGSLSDDQHGDDADPGAG